MKLCIDCKWVSSRLPFQTKTCSHPNGKAKETQLGLVEGRPASKLDECWVHRYMGTLCGPDALLFESVG